MPSHEFEVTSKRQKTGHRSVCDICGKKAPLDELTSPQDSKSWHTLYEAATIRNFQPIINLCKDSPTTIPEVKYHRQCRSNFTHKATLATLTKEKSVSSENNPDQRRSQREGSSSHSRVYEKICIFCKRKSKYIKGTNRREPLTQAVETRADCTLREIAQQRLDTDILAITSRDIIAAEAQYHKTCYRDYTRKRPDNVIKEDNIEEESCSKQEKEAFKRLFDFIRNDLFTNPRILPLTELRAKFISFMNDCGVTDVRDCAKKHVRRYVEYEFGDAIQFFYVQSRTYIRPDNLSIESIASDYVVAKNKLDKHDTFSETPLENVALLLREEIKQHCKEQSWPPHPDELNSDYITLPDTLIKFLTLLLGGKQQATDRINRLSTSIAQDIITAVTVGKVLTPKHVLLSWVIKSLTGNVELIKMMNRLGHSCSYTTLEEIDTALCMEKLEVVNDNSVPIPLNIVTDIPTVVAYDNIDRQEEVLSGSGTSHRVNGIIIQPRTQKQIEQKPETTVKKSEKRRTIPFTDQTLTPYISVKRRGPPPITPTQLDEKLRNESIQAENKNHLWIMVRLVDQNKQDVSSWTGFNIKIRDNIIIPADTVGYLPTINAPATDMSTVQEILNQTISIQESLNLKCIAVVLDQALFSKASEIMWRYQEKYKSIILMMGNFHTICNLMSIIGKMFGDAGLRDLAVESGVIAAGSIEKVLEGKQYNRAVRFHKLTYEALMRLVYVGFEAWVLSNVKETDFSLNDILPIIEELHANMCATTYDETLRNEKCVKLFNLFNAYLKDVKENRGQLSQFWMQYVDLVEILLGLLRADREGNWYLHLSCIRRMIPWCFAMDKINYARYLSVYYAQMTCLQEKSPELYDYFHRGGFSVQLKEGNPFGRIAIDQTTEETVNKDTQTPGGTRGFSLKPGTVARYYLTAEHRATALRQLREQVRLRPPGFRHPDLETPRIKRDECDIQSIQELLEGTWTNPFQEDPQDLTHLSTGVVAPLDVSADLLLAEKKGEDAYNDFQEQRLNTGEGFYDSIKKLKLKTFCSGKQKKIINKNKEIMLKADRKLFGNMVLIAFSRKLDMRQVLSHPLGPFPWALANVDGTIKKTNKAILAKHLESFVSPIEEVFQPCATIVDAMSLIQKLHCESHTFEELSDLIISRILNVSRQSERIDVIFDIYRTESIKSAERVNRGSLEGMNFSQIKPGHKIKNWRRILASSESKDRLTHFLAESWKDTKRRKLLGEKTMFVTYGEQCLKLTQDNYEAVTVLQSNQEEADTRIMLHAKHAADQYPTIICITDDTDVFIIGLALCDQISSKIIIQRGTKANVRQIDITKLACVLGKETCNSLIGLHAWTGCDTISSLSGQGKLKALKIILHNDKFRNVFSSLGSQWEVSTENLSAIQEFTCQLYKRNTKVKEVNELRYQMFLCKKGDVESSQLPPCEDALKQHTIRANYQAAIWRRSLENYPCVPSPTNGHGWVNNEEGDLNIQWITTSPAPDAVLCLLSCKCKRVCNPSDCSCITNGLKCTPACVLHSCSNMGNDDGDDNLVQDDNDLYSSEEEDK